MRQVYDLLRQGRKQSIRSRFLRGLLERSINRNDILPYQIMVENIFLPVNHIFYTFTYRTK